MGQTLQSGEHIWHKALKLQLSSVSFPLSYCRDSSGRSPYCLAREKAVRDVFRRFMAQFPTAYDYAAAQVPSPLTEEKERERREKAAEKEEEEKRREAKEKGRKKGGREGEREKDGSKSM